LGNYKNNYDIATKTAQWALTPKQLSLVLFILRVKIAITSQLQAK